MYPNEQGGLRVLFQDDHPLWVPSVEQWGLTIQSHNLYVQNAKAGGETDYDPLC